MKNIIIFGSPGAGKGTQAARIKEEYNLNHISTGVLLRQEVSSKGSFGPQIEKCQKDGTLVPNKILTPLVTNFVQKYKNGNGFIFDGYPRSVEQAEILDNILEKAKLKLSLVINLVIREEEAIKRLSLRGKTSKRKDDNEETIRNRFVTYNKQTRPVLDYYQQQDKIVDIHGEGTIEEIAKEIKDKIG